MPAKTPEERIGSTIGQHYELLRVIGKGAMGVVYGARHNMTGREVALKLLQAHHAENPTIAKRFLLEARAAGQLRHPHVVEVLDMGHGEDGTVFMVMELLEGESLGETLRRGPVEVTSAVRLLDPILDALEAAHRAGVVHRDLKPDNIFFNQRGQQVIPKIVDFGLAKIADGAHARLTRTGTAMGTPWYMAPEQIKDSKTATPSADIWAFAMVFYLTVTKKRPYHARTAVQILSAILRETPRPLEEADPSLPLGVCAAIRDALHRDPTQRPGAAELATRLRTAVGLPAAGPLPHGAQGTSGAVALPPPDVTQPIPAMKTDPHFADLDPGSGDLESLPGTATLPDLPEMPMGSEVESNPDMLLKRLREESAGATTEPLGRRPAPVTDSSMAPTLIGGPLPPGAIPPSSGGAPAAPPQAQATSAQATNAQATSAQATNAQATNAQATKASSKLMVGLVVVIAILVAVIAVLAGALLSLASG